MLQIKNTLGGGKPEGLYVWKKNSYSPAVSLENPTFDYISANVSSSSSDYTFGNFSFDISIIDDWTKFFTGFVNTNGYGSNFPSDGVFHNYSDNGNWNYTVSEVNLSAGTVTIHIGGQCGDYKSEGTYKYTGTKVVSEEIKEFLDYIVSDKETAYPDGGEKGGYWYEKVGGFLTGTITQTTSGKKTLSFEYGSVKKPKAFYLMHMGTTDTSYAPNYLVYNTWYDELQGLNNGAYVYYASPYVYCKQGSGSATCEATFNNGTVTLGGNNYYYGTYLWVAIF